MSYLLDALQKADRERSEKKPSTEQFIVANAVAGKQRTSSPTLLIFAAGAAALLALVIWAISAVWPDTHSRQVVALSLPAGQPAVARENNLSGYDSSEAAQPELHLEITGHLMVGPGHSANKLFTDQGTLRTGSVLESGWRLIHIGEYSAEFKLADQARSIPLR
ncbi:MAG: hypothetical protein ACN4EJ_04655 [Porticoccaceae bacterium]